MTDQRYQRQTILPQIGQAGQEKLAHSCVLIVGCGALGSIISQQLVRAGVGFVRIVDRDLVELTNLQRQVLFDETDVRDALPKAVAAARHLARINSQVVIDPVVMDVDSGNIRDLLSVEGQKIDLIVDGSDNAQIRYLINDLSVQQNIPWVYGGVVGVQGRVMPIWPGVGPCLRCLFPTPPVPGELPTCDVAGVLGPAAAIVGAWESTAALRILVEGTNALEMGLIVLDVWEGQARRVALEDARCHACPCCGKRDFVFLNAPAAGAVATLCGRDAVQVRSSTAGQGLSHASAGCASHLNLAQLAQSLQAAGRVQQDRFFVRLYPHDTPEMLTIFADGRVIVSGTRDPARARTLVARWVGG
ncbi:MAG: ThiF family adenylyltransferase [Phycisphaerales bacterium]|nr:ThiF family adenylyltransferase [Phycisphaerales bacterium]